MSQNLAALLALWLRRKTRAPVHFDVHECFDEVVAARKNGAPRPDLAQWLVGRVVAAVVRQCDWVTVVSPVLAGQLATARFDGRITVIYNSPPIEGFPHEDQSRVPPLVVCHEGWLDNSRGMSQLLHSVAIARRRAEVRLLVVGKVRPQCQEEFAQLVAQLDLKAAVTVTGWVAYNEVGRYDAQAQVGLVTMQPSGNNYNGLSNKLFSYMACGQAVIVPAGSASEELATRFGAGIAVDATDPASIADAIVRLHDDHDLRRELGRRGRAAIESELGGDRCGRDFKKSTRGLQPKAGGHPHPRACGPQKIEALAKLSLFRASWRAEQAGTVQGNQRMTA